MNRLAKIEQPSAQALFVRTCFNEQVLGSATGFVVSASCGAVLVTNRHVVTGRNNETGELISQQGAIPNRLLIRHNGAGPDLKGVDTVVEVREELYNAGAPLWFEHPRYGPRVDVVALPLRRTRGVELRPLDIYDSADARISCRPTEIVSVIGFPFGLTGPGQFAIWATGFIATEPGLLYDGLPLVLIDCRTRIGQSGSPVIAYRIGTAVLEDEDEGVLAVLDGPLMRFVGVYSGRLRDDSDIGRVWTAAAIRELIEAIPPDAA